MFKESKIDVIIPARMGSARLPGKTLSDLNGKPMILQQIDRILESELVDRVILATTILDSDDILASWCYDHDILCYRGSSNNVFNRIYSAAKFYNSEFIVVILGDNPVVYSGVIDEVVTKYFNGPDIDFVTTLSMEYKNYTTLNRYFPVGVRVQILSYPLLEKLERIVVDAYNKEHSTNYIVKNQKNFNIHYIQANKNFEKSYLPNYNFAVNTLEQLDSVNEIFRSLGDRNFSLEDVVSLVKKNENLFTHLKL